MDATQIEQVGSAWLSKNAKRRYGFGVRFDIGNFVTHILLYRKDKHNFFYSSTIVGDTFDLSAVMAKLLACLERLFRRVNRMSRSERKRWRMKNG